MKDPRVLFVALKEFVHEVLAALKRVDVKKFVPLTLSLKNSNAL
jgi:hypothetical protein